MQNVTHIKNWGRSNFFADIFCHPRFMHAEYYVSQKFFLKTMFSNNNILHLPQNLSKILLYVLCFIKPKLN